jgi:hypothetical protein
VARLRSPSHAPGTEHEEAENLMFNLKQKLLTAVIVLGLSVSGFAQKGGDNSNKRPPKDAPPQVVVKGKETKPPPKDNKGKERP